MASEMEVHPALPHLLEDALRLHREEVNVILETWMSRLNTQLAVCWTPAAMSTTTKSEVPLPIPLPMHSNGEIAAKRIVAEMPGSLPAVGDERPAVINPSANLEMYAQAEETDSKENNDNSKEMLGSSTDRADSSYIKARQTEFQISQAFNKLGAISFYGKKPRALSSWEVFRAQTRALVSSQRSNLFWALVILTNSVYLGVHLEWSVDHRGEFDNSIFFVCIWCMHCFSPWK